MVETIKQRLNAFCYEPVVFISCHKYTITIPITSVIAVIFAKSNSCSLQKKRKDKKRKEITGLLSPGGWKKSRARKPSINLTGEKGTRCIYQSSNKLQLQARLRKRKIILGEVGIRIALVESSDRTHGREVLNRNERGSFETILTRDNIRKIK